MLEKFTIQRKWAKSLWQANEEDMVQGMVFKKVNFGSHCKVNPVFPGTWSSQSSNHRNVSRPLGAETELWVEMLGTEAM